ncbi:hypothetical protein ACJX0J_030585, partial [Zea mays]
TVFKIRLLDGPKHKLMFSKHTSEGNVSIFSSHNNIIVNIALKIVLITSKVQK